MARPRKTMAVATGKIGKDKIEQRRKQEQQLKLDRDGLTPPPFLNLVGSAEFIRVVDEAGKVDLLDNLDLSVLAIYCNAYSQYTEITKQLQESEFEYRYMTDNGKVSPLINAQDKIVKQIMSCSTKLGLATTDRLKLIVPTKEESTTNKYLKYLNG
ncbi:P27 family predicted phage terminase small subunit [Peptoniphilus olsenii]|uniref:P27 family predicted phage terminase small subunit n=1 Tax=Peptoniphilus olsenii TaxID=411570 RepID=A0ABV2J7K1_9FIRM